MVKDLIIVGATVGVLADAVKLIVNYILFLFGFTNSLFWQITAARFVEKGDLFKPVAYIIGGVADITVTAALGIIFVYVIYFTSKEHLWFKGVGFGMVIWVGLFGTLLGQTVQAKLPQEPAGILVTTVAHLFFGLGLAAFTRVFYRDKIEKSEKENQPEYRFVPMPAKKIIFSDSKKNDTKNHKKDTFKKPIKLDDLKKI